MSGPPIDLLAVLEKAVVVRDDALRGRNARSVLNVNSESVQRACGRIFDKLDRIDDARDIAAELIEALKAFVSAHDLDTDDRMLAGMQMGCAYEMARAALARLSGAPQ